MYVVAGLGNPGRKYAATRHNAGYRAVDRLAEMLGVKLKTRRFKALTAECVIGSEKVMLVKPETYMNLSGNAVRDIAFYFDVPPEHVIVIYDDMDLPLGSLRIRKSGGPGTHNGMKSVVSCLGTRSFPRIRIGIGEKDDEPVDYVIGKVPKTELALLGETEQKAAEAVIDLIDLGIDAAMNRHNTKKDPDEE